MTGPADKLAALRARLQELESVLVCFSGGADSALLLRVAHDVLGARAVGLLARSPAVPDEEVADARRVAATIGARLEEVESRELERPGYVANAPDRCYHCKVELMELARPRADALGLRHVCLGTNVDDLGDHRPGKAAADERGARHPLLDAGLTKAEIRALSRELGLSTWDKPQAACLASRIPYGTPVSADRLRRVGRFEQELARLGFSQIRVRWHDAIARIELGPDELPRALAARDAIVAAGRALGFTYVTLDLAGYRQGAMNEVLAGR